MINNAKKCRWITLILLLSSCRLIPNQTGILPTETSAITTNTLQVPTTDSNLPTLAVEITESTYSVNTPRTTEVPTLIRYSYQLQANTPAYIQNFAHTEQGCNWIGIAGQVFGEDGQPLENLVVVVKGNRENLPINSVTLTGLESASAYGPGGYEIVFDNQTFASQGAISTQVFDIQGNPLSDSITFDTFDDCTRNLIIINFN